MKPGDDGVYILKSNTVDREHQLALQKAMASSTGEYVVLPPAWTFTTAKMGETPGAGAAQINDDTPTAPPTSRSR